MFKVKPESTPVTRIRSNDRSDPNGYNFHLTLYQHGLSSDAGDRTTVFFSAYASDYDDILHLLLSKKIHLNVKDQLDPLKTCAHVIEPQDQRPLMTLSPHPQWDVFFLTLILSGMTLFLFIISIFSKLYWGAGDIDAWNVLPVKSSELSEPAEVSSCAVYGISTFEHEECQ